MRIPFLGGRRANRTEREPTEPDAPLLRRKRSAPALGARKQEHEPFPEELKATFASQKSKRQSIANFFQSTSSSRDKTQQTPEEEPRTDAKARTLRNRASRIFRPATSHGHVSSAPDQSEPDVRPFQLDEKFVREFVNQAKEEKRALEMLQAEQKSRIQATLHTSAESQTHRSLRDEEELQHMFEGAPRFEIVRTKTGYEPRVHFPGQQPAHVDQTDHIGIDHVSLQRLLNERGQSASGTSSDANESPGAVRGVSGLHNATGIDAGATSFAHFLRQPLTAEVCASAPLDPIKRRLLHTHPEQVGLQCVDVETMVDRFSELSLMHEMEDMAGFAPSSDDEQRIAELGQALFSRVLCDTPESLFEDRSLRSQIDALQTMLNIPGLWHDFTVPDIRLRLGELMPYTNDKMSDVSPSITTTIEQSLLLLQILVASELLVRVNMVRKLGVESVTSSPLFSESDHLEVEADRTSKIDWDLVLADEFLANVDASASTLASSTGTNPLLGSSLGFTSDDGAQLALSPKHIKQQVSGLLHFAENIRWPDAETVENDLLSMYKAKPRPFSAMSGMSVYITPPQSPVLKGLSNTSDHAEETQVGGLIRRDTAQSTVQRQSTSKGPATHQPDPEIWLSQTWLHGLALSDDTCSILLMSTLLQNTPHAPTVSRNQLQHCSGFRFGDRIYWNKTSVVGRVLSASKDSRECLGWISTPHGPGSQLDSVIPPLPQKPMEGNSLARIFSGSSVSRESDPMGRHDRALVKKTDFKTPGDGLLVMGNEVRFEGCRIAQSSQDMGLTRNMICTFVSPINSKLAKLELALTHDIHFVSSYPCHPASKPERAPSSLSANSLPSPRENPNRRSFLTTDAAVARAVYAQLPAFEFEAKTGAANRFSMQPLAFPQRLEREQPAARMSFCPPATSSGVPTLEAPSREPPAPPAHPLHVDYAFDVTPVATLLSSAAQLDSGEDCAATQAPLENGLTLSTPADVAGHGVSDKDGTLILDCRGTDDLQLLARAWCAQVGEHALISKVGRTCLACSVREARALGMNIVIRIA